jgi:uncharacterized phiE125 gp8 family phage protein
MILTQTTPPAYRPLTLDQVKLHCRVIGTAEDTVLGVYLDAAVGACEHELGRSIMAQGWRATLDTFPRAVRLPKPTIQSINGITYWDTEGDPQSLDLDFYELTGDTLGLVHGATLPALWRGAGVVQINYTAGYATGSEAAQQAAVPANIKSWLLLTVGAMYANRESIQVGVSVAELPGRFVGGLLDAHRVYG